MSVARADAIVVAAGSGRRMGGDKLALTLLGRPLLAWSVEAVAAAPSVDRIVIVTAADRVARLAEAPWLPTAVSRVVAGGARRQESVAAGLAVLADGPPDDVILVHDGARPLASPALVELVIEAAALHGAAIPVLPVVETVKRLRNGWIEGTVERADLAIAQTPQAARRAIFRRAVAERSPYGHEQWTDEGALFEACRIPVHAIPGEATNLKVTVPDDLVRAEAILARRLGAGAQPAPTAAAPMVGIGRDSHAFGPGEPLVLGGVEFAGAPRLHGHSDGDVALHAVADALLGAAALGDLGRLFPAGPETPRGIASRELLADVRRRLHAAGLEPIGLDMTIIGARPRLAARLDEIRAAVAGLLGLDPTTVSVKASTANLAGMEGAGRGMSAIAIARVGPVASTRLIGEEQA